MDAWDAIKDNEFFSFEVSSPPGERNPQAAAANPQDAQRLQSA